MKSLNSALLILVILTNSACRDNRPVQDNPVKPIGFKTVDAIDLTPYIEEIRFFHLDPHKESIFAQADKILVDQDLMFILDKSLKSVLCFDTAGSFRFRIQRVGQGPGEYNELNGIWIRPETKELFLHCRLPAKNLVYNYRGQFMREYPVDYGAIDITGLKRNLTAGFTIFRDIRMRDSLLPGLFLMKEDGSFVRQLARIGEISVYWSVQYQRNFDTVGEGAILLSQSDTIYRIDPNGERSIDFVLDPGSWRMPDELRKVEHYAPRDQEVFTGSYLQTKDQLIAFGPVRLFWFTRENQQHFYLVDIRQEIGYYSNVIRNDLTHIPTIFPFGKSDKDELIGILDMGYLWMLKEHLDRSRSKEVLEPKIQEIYDLVNKAIINDRPVMYFARIKQKWLEY